MALVIEVNALHYRYGHGGDDVIDALNGADLQVRRGDYLALIGPNGSGKSTLAKCLSGLLTPTAGDVRVNGLSTRDHDALIGIRSAVGMVFQNPDNQFVTSMVEAEVAFGPENLGIPPDEIRVRVDRALAQVKLAGSEARDPHTLSAGGKARLAIASVLAMEPDCLILDEATAMLDPASRRSVLALVDELHAGGMTVIVVTHHMTEVTHAERVAVMEAGRIAFEGTPAEVFADGEGLARLGLALPPAAAIAQGLVARGLALSPTVVTADGLVRDVALLHEAQI
ncbi:MAG: energy-coupling factor transporter ATPase [Anaerolineae bacterium]